MHFVINNMALLLLTNKNNCDYLDIMRFLPVINKLNTRDLEIINVNVFNAKSSVELQTTK